MRYDDFRRSDDIEDRRDDSGGGFGGGLGLPIGGGGLVIGGGQTTTSYQTDRPSGQRKTGAPSDEMGSMIAGILGEIDDRWSEQFTASGRTYTGPKVVLFRNATNGGRCGMAQ